MSLSKKEMVKVYACGVAMGAADVVPGVSGGTIAFITGIYHNLLMAIQAFDRKFFQLFFTAKFKQALGQIPFDFLIPLLLGILTSIVSLANVIIYLLEHKPLMIWTFFLGLILGSTYLLARELPKKNVFSYIIFFLGFLLALSLSYLPSMQMPNGFLYTMIAGAIAISAMILPGISGSYLLVIMGKYDVIINAVAHFDVMTLGAFLIGAALGLLSFVRIVNFALKRFYSGTIAFLTGIMLGSLRHILMQIPSPAGVGDVLTIIIFTLIGIAIPLVLNKLANK